ncbi:MAG: hypothetical protein JW956_04265 [Calditrichaceae bacterium]|nr:hypothetical protein [Calditrichaceae bacterium]
MKLFLSILIVSILTFSAAIAQDGNLNVDLQKIQNTENWEFNMDYKFAGLNSTGIFIELPQKFSVTPISVMINNQNMWLKNSDNAVDNDAAIHWENTEGGLILRFSSNIIQSATQLTAQCMVQTSDNINQDEIISIKPMIDNDQISDEIIASNNLNITR